MLDPVLVEDGKGGRRRLLYSSRSSTPTGCSWASATFPARGSPPRSSRPSSGAYSTRIPPHVRCNLSPQPQPLSLRHLPLEYFVTGIFIELDMSTGQSIICDMGHSYVLVQDDTTLFRLGKKTANPPLGIVQDLVPRLSNYRFAPGRARAPLHRRRRGTDESPRGTSIRRTGCGVF